MKLTRLFVLLLTPCLFAMAPEAARLDVDVVDASPLEVFTSLGAALGIDGLRFEGTPEGRLTMRLERVTAETALDAACESLGCAWRREDSHLVVACDPVDEGNPDLATPMTWSLKDASTVTVLESLARILGVSLSVDDTTAEMQTTLELERTSTADLLDALCRVQGCQWRLDHATGALLVGRAGYGMQLRIDPTADDSVFLCRALVTDLSTGEIVSAPSVTFRAGDPISVQTALPDGRLIALEATFDRDDEVVVLTAELSENGRVVARQGTQLAMD